MQYATLCSRCTEEAPEVFGAGQVSGHYTRADLACGEEAGCDLCSLVLYLVHRSGSRGSVPGLLISLQPLAHTDRTRKARRGDFRERGLLEIKGTSKEVSWLDAVYGRFTVSTDADSPYSDNVQGRTVTWDEHDASGYRLARKWLKDCCDDHVSCGRPAPGRLPDRVLDVSGFPERLFVHHTDEDEHGTYCALSYCWGSEQPHFLTNDRLDQYSTSIEPALLPKTIYEAATLTRELGISYLWVDSMCIIQDNDKDKRHQISQMDRIFKAAHVTVLVMAPSVNDGFLHASEEWASLVLHLQRPDGTFGTVMLHEHDMQLNEREPSEYRAWTLEERMLSPRILSFSTRFYDLGWECRGLQQCNNHDRWALEINEMKPALPDFVVDGSNSHVASAQQLKELQRTWHNTVSDYTSRRLTDAKDKLRAIGGLAAGLLPHLGPNYYAGIFSRNLLFDLLWECAGAGDGGSLEEPDHYQAPSWSWASKTGAVMYRTLNHGEPMAVISDVGTELLHDNLPFGAVKRGWLSLSTRIAEAPIQPADFDDEDETPLQWVVGHCKHEQDVSSHEFIPDTAASISHARAWCIPIVRTQFELEDYDSDDRDDYDAAKNDVLIGLVLVRHQERPDVFQRIGTFQGPAFVYDWLLEAAEQTITIL